MAVFAWTICWKFLLFLKLCYGRRSWTMPIRSQFFQWTCPDPIFRQGHRVCAKNLVSGTRLRCLKRQDCKYSPFQAKFSNGKYSHRLWSVIRTKCWESFMWSHSESECVKERKALVSNSTLVWIHSPFSELQCCCSGFPTSTKACQGVVWHKTHEYASTPPLDLNRWLPLIHTCKSYFDLTCYAAWLSHIYRHRNSLGQHVCSLVDLVLRPS